MDNMGAHVALWVFIGAIYLLSARDKLVQHLVSEDEEVEEIDGYRKP